MRLGDLGAVTNGEGRNQQDRKCLTISLVFWQKRQLWPLQGRGRNSNVLNI
jgi:hypothetical protein